ncbi:MAG: hypothetical protein JNJ46_05755 [Myxococcales bacterium]|nr:hypothetical protein [Myxococcales bacterium]
MQVDHRSVQGGESKASATDLRSSLRLAILAAGLLFVTSQMTCAEVANFWGEDTPQQKPSDGGDTDGGDGMWRCFMGTPSKEEELLNRCTEAERIDRPSAIPPAKWDGKSPLPYQ